MDDIIKQLEACHDAFSAILDDIPDAEGMQYDDLISLNRALIDRLKAIPTWHMSVDEMQKYTPEGE